MMLLLRWVAMLVVGDRWSPSDGEREAVESGGVKSWWLGQRPTSTPAEKDAWPVAGWPDIGMADGGISGAWERASSAWDPFGVAAMQQLSELAMQ